jgi:hypothetical protein
MAMMSIAHPDFREVPEREACANGLIPRAYFRGARSRRHEPRPAFRRWPIRGQHQAHMTMPGDAEAPRIFVPVAIRAVFMRLAPRLEAAAPAPHERTPLIG